MDYSSERSRRRPHSILIKGGIYLEEGRKLKALALDKTGTLTHGKTVVTDIKELNYLASEKALQIAASQNAHSEHPMLTPSSLKPSWIASC